MLPAQPELLTLLLGLIFFVAFAYSSVGHGGASGYLAALSFFGFAPAAMAPSALLLNLLVAGLSFVAYWRAGHFVWRLLWPFLLTSIPFAFLGGLLGISPRVYLVLLAAVLLFASFRLFVNPTASQQESFVSPPTFWVALPVGAAIGFLSGMVGVGGGIFLSPLVILLGWADAKRTAAVSAAFIWINSVAGLYGHLSRTSVDWPTMLWLVGAAFIGGALGSTLGARRFRGLWLRRILAVVLLFAVLKLLRTAS
jgi:hypothetical protein